MKDWKIQLGTIAGIALLLWWAIPALASDETKIRWRIEEAVEAFNDGSVRSAIEILADGYRDESSGADKNAIRGYLVTLFLRKQNSHEGRFRYPVRIVDGTLDIVVGASEDPGANVTGRVVFEDLAVESSPPRWELDIRATLAKVGGVWVIERTRFETLSGSPPF